ncbi:hypothetical protein M422DRAFT_190612 [Sphaerobolus stellatus SS14]|uniref:CxC6 like cysteine cluster associated with KDZ domain-containing protein n=1 Tax=Sphaerobolus stellatus (strain SS14) TaxID=990650 RepID=A0A0C9UR18_SPHS4|nr:hypothetical protein M422DRAFT_190612 [Sphaerobolus stellatus SS14]
MDEIQELTSLKSLPKQQRPPPGVERGYVRLAVTDGKTLKFRICAKFPCNQPLENYANGRFCADHQDWAEKCGIEDCEAPIHKPGAYTSRSHRFRARTSYCLQTIQWSCGIPISWGICYESESPTQVFQLLDFTWPDEDTRPSFIAYDNACKMLAHIVKHPEKRHWLRTTRFIVDAWHYINHRATDVLCCTWCNPHPNDGSQPDLVITTEGQDGIKHLSRAFNTETAEQFNSWMDGYDAQMRQMAKQTFAFYSHCTLLLYKEEVEERITKEEKWM